MLRHQVSLHQDCDLVPENCTPRASTYHLHCCKPQLQVYSLHPTAIERVQHLTVDHQRQCCLPPLTRKCDHRQIIDRALESKDELHCRRRTPPVPNLGLQSHISSGREPM